MMKQITYFFTLFILIAFQVSACDEYCINESANNLWEPASAEYRLVLTHRGESMIELIVDGESLGVFCGGVKNLAIGNFPQDRCSRIEAVFFDNPDRIWLDDCAIVGKELCSANNENGEICYDTRDLVKVMADLE